MKLSKIALSVALLMTISGPVLAQNASIKRP
jgi:hypothetical protein